MSVLQLSNGTPVQRTGRAILVGIAMFLIAGFVGALSVSPDPRGYGTHQQFGLPPCTFRLLSGYPCPGCGMTTCFAHFVRGQFVDAARANLAGLFLAATCAFLIPWCLISALVGRIWLVSNPVEVGVVYILSLSGLAVALWVIQLMRFVS